MLTKHDFGEKIRIRIPTREEWESNLVMNTQEIAVHTDASVISGGTGIGIFSEELDIRQSLRLSDGCNVLQAEVYAIKEAASCIREKIAYKPIGDIVIYSDNLGSLRSIIMQSVRSKTVMDCREAFSWLCQDESTLCWVPDHRNVVDNQDADRLAK